MTWHPGAHPPDGPYEVVLALNVGDNTGAGLDEVYRIAWWDTNAGHWVALDCDHWVGSGTFKPGDPWLRAWARLIYPGEHK